MQDHPVASKKPPELVENRDVLAASPWLTQREAAAYLKLAVGTIRNLTSSKVLPFSRRGRIVRYRRDALDAWLAKGACPGRRSLAHTQPDGAPSRSRHTHTAAHSDADDSTKDTQTQ